MQGQLRMLNFACAAKARPRTVILTRPSRDEALGTVCPGSSDPFYILTYYIRLVTTSWTHSNKYITQIQSALARKTLHPKCRKKSLLKQGFFCFNFFQGSKQQVPKFLTDMLFDLYTSLTLNPVLFFRVPFDGRASARIWDLRGER